jgi:hypothetical protein
MICIKHNEAFSLDKGEVLNHIFNNTDKIFVLQKKETLYHFPHPEKLYDINFIEYVNINDNIIVNKCIEFYYRKHYNNPIINSLIPISKHYEEQDSIFDMVIPIIRKYNANDVIYQFNNNLSSVAFHRIEEAGIALNKRCFVEHYNDKLHYPEFNIYKGKIYTQYNLYTTTSRPSNRFNGINFAALNKESGARKSFIPQNDLLIEFDISSYHPTLANKLMGENFNISHLYEEVGKENVFRQLYGGIQEQYLDIPFFAKCKEYIDNNWKNYNNSGKVIVPLSGYCIENVENPNPYKLFNYILQNYETALNTIILRKIITLLRGKQTKPVLYVYDSILLDYAKTDGKELLEQIKDVFSQHELTVKIKFGPNYDSLCSL